jgi:hypothetical protein
MPRYSGAYQMSDGSYRVITPSDAPDLRYRALSGESGKLYRARDRRYESGRGGSVREPVALQVLFGSRDEGSPIEVVVYPDAGHGMIAVEEGRRLAGHYAKGYFEMLIDWILEQAGAANR